MMRQFLLFCVILTYYSCHQTSQFDTPWNDILVSDEEIFNRVIDSLESYEVQVIYTDVIKKEAGIEFNSYELNVNDNLYFYPASTVKMPVAFLAIEYINELALKNQELDIFTRIAFDSIASPQSSEYVDTTSITGYPNVAHYIEQIFAVSDNNAFNRLYELLGQDYINEKLREKGIFINSKIIHRVGVSGFDSEANKYTNPYQLIGNDATILYEQDELYALYDDYPVVENTIKGVGYYDDNLNKVIKEPFDFSTKNFISLKELQASLLRVIYPELYSQEQQFLIHADQRKFLLQAMKKTPHQYDYLKGHDQYYDSYVKFFMYGDSEEPIPNHIEISNKVGWAYGYLTDCAHIRDTQNDIEFFLTATIHVNRNQIYNDGNYEYETIGLPFLAELGRLIYQYELKKERQN